MRLADLDQPYLRGFESLSALDNIDDNRLSFVEACNPGSFKSRDVDEHVLPAVVPSNKPETLSALNHFTVPVSSTARSEDGPPDVAGRGLDPRGAVGTAVLLSTLSTSVTCGPVCPGRWGLGAGVTGIRFPVWLDSGSISDPGFELRSVTTPTSRRCRQS